MMGVLIISAIAVFVVGVLGSLIYSDSRHVQRLIKHRKRWAELESELSPPWAPQAPGLVQKMEALRGKAK